MNELPAPPIPDYCDVRHLRGFMLDTDKIMSSELWALSSGDEFKAAFTLWCRAWKQVPAASLPDDEKILSAFSGAGSKWKKVKQMALRGFVKCSDGRLYHIVLAQDAFNAWSKSQAYSEKAKRAAQAKWSHEKIDAPSMLQASSKHPQSNATSIDQASKDECLTMPKDKDKDNIITSSLHSEVIDVESSEKGNENDGRSKQKTKRGSRISADWQPSEEDIRFAESLGLGAEIGQARDEFVDYWIAATGKSASKLDWSATWRNKCRNLVKFRKRSDAPGARQRPGSNGSSLAAAIGSIHATLDRYGQGSEARVDDDTGGA